MVTTTSLEPNWDVSARDLIESDLLEDRELAKEVEKFLASLIQKLMPVILYVDTMIGKTKGIIVATTSPHGGALVLTRDGTWSSVAVCEDSGGDVPNEWEYYLISEILTGLERAFEEAINKKQKHLAALEARRKVLTTIGSVVRSAE